MTTATYLPFAPSITARELAPRIASSEVVEPHAMTADAREALADELYAVQSEIFSGVSKDEFVRYVIASKAARTWIQLHRSEAGQLVGYFAVHLFEHDLDGQTIAVLRGEVGVLRAYRGARRSGVLLIEKGLRYKLMHPTRPLYFLCSPVHPGSYAMIVNYADEAWPNPYRETPADVAALSERLADEFGMERVNADDPQVVRVGWTTRDRRADQSYWHQHLDPAVQFFLAANPGYTDGNGLVTLVPTNVLGGLRSALRLVSARLSRQCQRWTRLAQDWNLIRA